MNEYQTAVYDEYADTYDEGLAKLLGTNDIDKFAEYKIQLLKCLCPISKFRNNNSKNIEILDFGCGTGHSLSYLEKYYPEEGIHFSGCDVSRESLKIAKKNFPAAKFFLNTSVEEFGGISDQYDIVILACVLHHIAPPERQQWIQAIIRKLKHGGKLIVFEHNLINPFTRKIVSKPKNKADDVNWMLKMSDIKKLLLCDTSVKIAWTGYTLFSLFRPFFMTSLERGLKWLPLGAQQCVMIEKK